MPRAGGGPFPRCRIAEMGFPVSLGVGGWAVCVRGQAEPGGGGLQWASLWNPLLRSPRVHLTCIVFVFIYPSAVVLFPLISLQRQQHVWLCLIFSKDLSPASDGGPADINIQLWKSTLIKQFPYVVCIFWWLADEINSPGNLTHTHTCTLSSLEYFRIISWMICFFLLHKDPLFRWVFLSKFWPIGKKERKQNTPAK